MDRRPVRHTLVAAAPLLAVTNERNSPGARPHMSRTPLTIARTVNSSAPCGNVPSTPPIGVQANGTQNDTRHWRKISP